MPARSLALPPTIARARWTLSLPSGEAPGELALATRWSRELDAELPGDLRFRAVLLTSQRGRVQPDNPHVFIVSSAPLRQAAARVVAEPSARHGVAAEVRLAVQSAPGLATLRRRAPDLLRLHAYLSAAVLPPQQEVLLLDRLSLLAQLSPVALLQHPQQWDALVANADWWRDRFEREYRRGHDAHRTQAAAAFARLQAAAERVQALARLDGMAGLGAPLGVPAMLAWRNALTDLEPCAADSEDEAWLAAAPWCPACGYQLTDPGPEPAMAAVLTDVERALSRQLRRLSTQAIRHIVQDAQRPALDRFLQVLQASDADALVRVLDDEVSGYLQALLADAQAALPLSGVLSELTARYGVIEASEIPAVVADFERLLRNAAAHAATSGPEGRVRFRLE